MSMAFPRSTTASPLFGVAIPLPRSATASLAIVVSQPDDEGSVEEAVHGSQEPPSKEEGSVNEPEPTFSSPSVRPDHIRPPLSNVLSSPAPSVAFTPTPAYPRPRARFHLPSPSSNVPATPSPQDHDDVETGEVAGEEAPLTPHTRRRSFLFSVINSTTRPRLEFPTRHATRAAERHRRRRQGRAYYRPGPTPRWRGDVRLRERVRGDASLPRERVVRPCYGRRREQVVPIAIGVCEMGVAWHGDRVACVVSRGEGRAGLRVGRKGVHRGALEGVGWKPQETTEQDLHREVAAEGDKFAIPARPVEGMKRQETASYKLQTEGFDDAAAFEDITKRLKNDLKKAWKKAAAVDSREDAAEKPTLDEDVLKERKKQKLMKVGFEAWVCMRREKEHERKERQKEGRNEEKQWKGDLVLDDAARSIAEKGSSKRPRAQEGGRAMVFHTNDVESVENMAAPLLYEDTLQPLLMEQNLLVYELSFTGQHTRASLRSKHSELIATLRPTYDESNIEGAFFVYDTSCGDS
ncbi:hypothetical protein B0H11DRAFT_2229128 [Mycena galericulata]|nr:hypothetical protein B0H11DRAFT_2229128 [Mycena galericulata]